MHPGKSNIGLQKDEFRRCYSFLFIHVKEIANEDEVYSLFVLSNFE